ncbi:MAG: hypothetical protein K0U74_13925 [Alphaproteobacteria bacterium]|nr:hypothetical protein [Alphaproteobacteria bacterium]
MAMKAGIGLVAVVTAIIFAGPAFAQKQSSISDKTVATLVNYAWRAVPPQVTLRSGKVVKFEQSKRKEIELPSATAKEIIVAAYRSYQAQICDLPAAMVANRDAMMTRFLKKGKWSEQQVQYANLLHAFVVSYMSGKVELRYIDENKTDVKVSEIAPEKVIEPKKCEPDQKKSVEQRIYNYYKATPGLKSKAAPAKSK